MAKITLHGMFARVMGKFNRSETLYFKRCNCGKEQLGVDLLNPVRNNKVSRIPQSVLPLKRRSRRRASTPPSLRTPLRRSMLNRTSTKMTKKEIAKVIISVLIAALTALAAGLGLSSCNVTRTVTTRSEAWQKGDTSVVIQTKTVESYDGSRKY